MGFIVSFTSLVVAPLFGQCLPTKLVPQDAAPGDRFGTSVAADETFAIIGAPGTVKNGVSIGAAYMFHVDDGSWFEQAKLVPDGAGPSAMFGQSVAMSAGVAVVGAPGDTHEGAATGAAYVFRLEGTAWVQEAKLVGSDSADGDMFGFSVSTDGTRILAGAPNAAGLVDATGTAYMFVFDGSVWSEETKLVSPMNGLTIDFGHAVAVCGDVAWIGSPLSDPSCDDGACCRKGGLSEFTFDGVAWINVFHSSAIDPGGNLGYALSCFAGPAVIGIPGSNTIAQNAGAAVLWGDLPALFSFLPSDGMVDDRFATSVSFDGDTVLIGSPGHSEEGGGAGAAYVYPSSQFEHGLLEVSKLYTGETESGDDFGVAVAVHGAFAFVGAPGDDGLGLDTGAVYAFRILGMTDCNENGIDDACEHGCNGNGIPDDCDIANGTSADCNDNGIPDECEPDCNANGSPDDCDIAAGKADDLNGNGLPDSCEDCNGNGFPDQWDVLNGTSEDANGNGIPDECDPPETGIRLAVVATGLVKPLLVTYAPDDFERVFIVEQTGRIKVHKGGQLLEKPFLDLSGIVGCCGESGLLGLAFPRDYLCDGDFYVNYTNAVGDTVIARYWVSDNPHVAEPEGEILLTIAQPGSVHNGGCIRFGGDGFLYVGMGDGGSHNGTAQDLSKLLGKMLRIDVGLSTGYAIPADNPFVHDGDIRDEIWAVGLRNPWRFSFDRQTGDMYIGDVGPALEEIGFEPGGSPGGRNHGWPCMTGFSGSCSFCCPCSMFVLTPPIFDYEHVLDEEAEAVIGGHVYRGCAIPDLTGTYIFGDLGRRVWSFRFDGETLTDFRERTESLTPSGEPLGFITSFGEDADGELYMCDYIDGRVLKFVPFATTGDFDLDGDVDISDFALMQECLAGPDPSAVDPCCRRFDFDLDADVDLADVARFWAALTDR